MPQTNFGNGPFSNILAEPSVAPVTTQPSGFQGAGGTIAQFAANFLRGASEGRVRARAEQEQLRERNHQRLAGMASMIQSNPDIVPQVKNQLLTTIGQRMMEQIASSDNGQKKGKKGSLSQPGAMSMGGDPNSENATPQEHAGMPTGSGHHAHEFIKGVAGALLGGNVQKARPIDENEILQLWDTARDPKNSIQSHMYGPGGAHERLTGSLREIQQNQGYTQGDITGHAGVQEALARMASLGVAPPKWYEEAYGHAPKTPLEALTNREVRNYMAEQQAQALGQPTGQPVLPKPSTPAQQPAAVPGATVNAGWDAPQTQSPAAQQPAAMVLPGAPPAAAAPANVQTQTSEPPAPASRKLSGADRLLSKSSNPVMGRVGGGEQTMLRLVEHKFNPSKTGYYYIGGKHDGEKTEDGKDIQIVSAQPGEKFVQGEFVDQGSGQKYKGQYDPKKPGEVTFVGWMDTPQRTTAPDANGNVYVIPRAPVPTGMPAGFDANGKSIKTQSGPPAAQPTPAADQPVQPPVPAPAQPVQTASGDAYVEHAKSVAKANGLDPEAFVRHIQQESGFKPGAVSPKGATGIAQFMPGTAAEKGVNPENPVTSLAASAQWIGEMTKDLGSERKAYSAYNMGPAALKKVMKDHPNDWENFIPKETSGHLGKVFPGGSATGPMTAQEFKAKSPFAAVAQTTAPTAAAPASTAPPTAADQPPIPKGGPKPILHVDKISSDQKMSAKERDEMLQVSNVSGNLDRLYEMLLGKNNGKDPESKTGFVDQTKDQIGNFGANFRYSTLHQAPDSKYHREALPLINAIGVQAVLPYLKGIRNGYWIKKIEEHIPKATDSDANLSGKIKNLRKVFAGVKADVLKMQEFNRQNKSKNMTPDEMSAFWDSTPVVDEDNPHNFPPPAAASAKR